MVLMCQPSHLKAQLVSIVERPCLAANIADQEPPNKRIKHKENANGDTQLGVSAMPSAPSGRKLVAINVEDSIDAEAVKHCLRWLYNITPPPLSMPQLLLLTCTDLRSLWALLTAPRLAGAPCAP